MSTAGDGCEMGGPAVVRPVDVGEGAGSGQNLEVEAGSRKRKAENEELKAKHECLCKNVVQILENQIDSKRKQLQQLVGLCDEDSNSKMVDESSAEGSAANGKADDENLKRLELELAKLDAEIQIKMDKLGEMSECEKFSEKLVSKYMETKMELEDIRKELIMELDDTRNPCASCAILRGRIGVKRMGEIDEQSLRKACTLYGIDEPIDRAGTLAYFWDQELKDPSWHPFKMVQANGKLQEVVDEDDAKLKQLRTEYGGDVYDMVKIALTERNEYNPNGLYPVPELWNFEEGRKATVKEALRLCLKKKKEALRQASKKKKEALVQAAAE